MTRPPTPRLFEFVPLWGFPVFLVYRMRRGCLQSLRPVVVEKVPWSMGKHHLTDLYRCFLAQCGPRSCRGRRWRAPSGPVGTRYIIPSSTWWNMASLIAALDHVTALGVDEIQYRKDHHYLTLLYQIDTPPPPSVVDGRRADEEDLEQRLYRTGARAPAQARSGRREGADTRLARPELARSQDEERPALAHMEATVARRGAADPAGTVKKRFFEPRRSDNGRYSRECCGGADCRFDGNHHFGRCEMDSSEALAAS